MAGSAEYELYLLFTFGDHHNAQWVTRDKAPERIRGLKAAKAELKGITCRRETAVEFDKQCPCGRGKGLII